MAASFIVGSDKGNFRDNASAAFEQYGIEGAVVSNVNSRAALDSANVDLLFIDTWSGERLFPDLFNWVDDGGILFLSDADGYVIDEVNAALGTNYTYDSPSGNNGDFYQGVDLPLITKSGFVIDNTAWDEGNSSHHGHINLDSLYGDESAIIFGNDSYNAGVNKESVVALEKKLATDFIPEYFTLGCLDTS